MATQESFMFQLAAVLGVVMFCVMTILRYISIIHSPDAERFHLRKLFSFNFQVKGAEAFTLMGQMIGLSWFVFGLVFKRLGLLSQSPFEFIVEDLVFWGSMFFWTLIFRSRIRA